MLLAFEMNIIQSADNRQKQVDQTTINSTDTRHNKQVLNQMTTQASSL
jgi:hypothetical protein